MRPNYTSIFITFIFFAALHSATAQGLTLLGSGGGYASSGDRHLSFSIGEPLIQHALNNGQWLTEGFQQPGHMELMVSTDQYAAPSDIVLYPNPATSSFTLSGSDLSDCVSVQVHNLIGQHMLSATLHDNQETILIEALHPGLYILTLQCSDKQYRSQSIIKL